MPIAIKELEKDRQSPAERIIEFLQAPAQRGKAFQAWEIVQAVDGVHRANALMVVLIYTMAAGKERPAIPTLDALGTLVEKGTLKQQRLDGQDYFYLPQGGT
ncbi:MAG: hypothetical protein QME96_14760 [Myxococcota bacterium]|nr:hypothetical protein [Myxococcota bacterium]